MTHPTLLVIDDSPEVISFLLILLEKEGYKILVAKSGEKALHIAKNNLPDLILLDVQLPDVTGYEICVKLKADNDMKHIPIIFLSAYTETFDKIKAFSVGGVDYITKPIETEETLVRINTHLTLSRLQKDLKKTNDNLAEKIKHKTKELQLTNEKLVREQKFSNTLINALQDTFFVFKPDTGKAVQWNTFFEKVSGYTSKEISRLKAPNSYYSKEDLDKVQKAVEILLETGKPLVTELELITKDKKYIPTEYTASLIRDIDGKPEYIVAIGRDITERKKDKDKILKSLHEKDLLLQEIHHRVKNNLQLISSLINMQISYIDDTKIHQHLYELRSRVDVMGQLHKELYKSEDFANINMNKYLSTTGNFLNTIYKRDSKNINYVIAVENVFMNLDTAMSCGILINEIVMNSLKHAFPDNNEGEIGISLHMNEEFYHLKVYDNGIGLPKNVDFEHNSRLGMQLINILVKQLHGCLKISRSKGTSYSIIF